MKYVEIVVVNNPLFDIVLELASSIENVAGRFG